MYQVCMFLFVIMWSTAGGVTGKAFLCRDPDTGKLHEVNTTWPSSTFCGNYHCKLRKKNLTETEYTPLRQINISNYDLQSNIPKKEQLFDKDKFFKKVLPKDEIVDIVGINNLIEPDIKNKYEDIGIETNSKEADSDRYLNEKEIKSISAILHTVKKSDLDAIIEIYNLAQDIYKEIDNTNPAKLEQEANNIDHNMDKVSKDQTLNKFEKKKTSYWYEPIPNQKPRSFDDTPEDMNSLGSVNIKVSTAKPQEITTDKPIIKYTNSLFDVALTATDFGTMPYYYPMSAFQRLSSYVRQPVTYNLLYTQPTPSVYKPLQDITKYQQNIKPSFYLPYPFSYIPHYNWTHPQNVYYYNQLKLSNADNSKVPISNAILINPDLENFQAPSVQIPNKNQNSVLDTEKSPKKKYEHDWQTDPISKQILNEVRAHVDKKLLKPFSLRKKITLERVGKVLKLDEITNRAKRSAIENSNKDLELYEVYIERTTCQANGTVPGYFKYGNMSKPFPECCPQRIS